MQIDHPFGKHSSEAEKHEAHVFQTWASQIFAPGTHGLGIRQFAVGVLLGLLVNLRRTINHKASSHFKNTILVEPLIAQNSISEYSSVKESPANLKIFR